MIEKKELLLLLLLLLALVSTVVLLVYITMKKNEISDYVYKNFQTDKRVVVSLTTSPKRIEQIKPVIDCMMNQTKKPDLIYLNLPKVFLRNNTIFKSELPEFITSNKLVKVNFCDDIGPATKIIPTVYNETDDETYILSIDDDIYYPPYIIESYLYYSDIFPDSIISGRSYMYNNSPEQLKIYNKMKEKIPEFKGFLSDLLEGFSGVLYQRKFFTMPFLSDFYKYLYVNSCKFGDDFYLSNFFKKNRVNIVSLNIPIDLTGNDKELIHSFEYGLKEDALHQGASGKNNVDNYKDCTKFLKSIGELYIDYYLNNDL